MIHTAIAIQAQSLLSLFEAVQFFSRSTLSRNVLLNFFWIVILDSPLIVLESMILMKKPFAKLFVNPYDLDFYQS